MKNVYVFVLNQHLLTFILSPLTKDSLQELSQLSKQQPVTEEAFDISASGELLLNQPDEGLGADHVTDSSTLKLRGAPFVDPPGFCILMFSSMNHFYEFFVLSQ